MRTLLLLLLTCAFVGCASKTKLGDNRDKAVGLIDQYTYLLTERTLEETYGYQPDNPIKVGGVKDSSGPLNERRFLNALLGPNGETVEYERHGSCCIFKTPNGLLDNSGLLDVYSVYWEGTKDTLDLYLNMYDEGNLYIPIGFNARNSSGQ